MERGEEVIRFKKEGKFNIAKVTRAERLNYWRGMGEDKYIKQKQRGIAVPNPYIVKLVKPSIADKYNNQIELKNLIG